MSPRAEALNVVKGQRRVPATAKRLFGREEHAPSERHKLDFEKALLNLQHLLDDLHRFHTDGIDAGKQFDEPLGIELPGNDGRL